MNIDLMNELLEYKDKNKSSQNKRTTFESEWLKYVFECGFDETAEKNLHVGFEYRKMHPLMTYVKKSGNMKETIQRFLNGSQFYKNKPKSFKMALNLLALLFVDFPEEIESIAMVIRRLPDISIGKDKQRNPEIGKILDKFFISELSSETVFPNIKLVGLRPAMQTLFISMMKDGIAAYKGECKFGPTENKILSNVEKWLSEDTSEILRVLDPAESKPTEHHPIQTAEISDITVNIDTPATENNHDNITINSQGKDNSSHDNEKGDDMQEPAISQWKQNLKIVWNYTESLEQMTSQLQQRLEDTIRAKDRITTENEQQKARIASATEEINELRFKNNEQMIINQEQANRITFLEDAISKKDAEIQDRIKLTDIISKDTAKQSDAVLKRLSGELSSYYEDFMSAEGVVMTTEIGEILRDQLTDIYKILKKNGILL